MSSALLVKGARRSLAQIRYVTPVPPGSAVGLVADVYAQTERDCGLLVPPIALHSPAPAALAAAWIMLRETLLAGGTAGRAEKEIVAAAVSRGNACPYCVTVHTAAARGLNRGPAAVPLADGRIDAIPDPGLRQLARWARGSGRPQTDRPDQDTNLPELAAVAVTFHYLNRMVSVFLPASPLPPHLPSVLGGPFMRMLASAMLSPSPAAGTALDLLPEASLPAEFSWAAGEPRVAASLARAATAIDEAGYQAVPPAVRELVLDRLNGWDGQPPGPSRVWADTAVAGLPAADRAAGRLALLTALAAYQVCPSDVEGLRPRDDKALIGLTSWASMAAARKIAAWLGAGLRGDGRPETNHRDPSPNATANA
jgi:AhpD family alkylhydroperoxidase